MANWETIGDFDCIVENSNNNNVAIVLFHGFGADADDLHPLCNFLDREEKASWYFPQGILEVILAPGVKGRAWFDIDMKSIEEAMLKGTYRDLTVIRPPNMDHVVELGLDFLSLLQKKYKKVVIGGFSQGSMLAVELFLRAVKKPQGLVVLSGALVDEKTIDKHLNHIKGLPLFISHGSNDAILDPRQAEKLYHKLKQAGMVSKFVQFKGGHEIPPLVLAELVKFLDAIF